jgi:hypothetical protein
MKSFLKEFLRDVPPASGDPRRICLGAFGKHPGWDDHMDDLGLETESLLMVRDLLYVQGIGGQLNTGAWDRLEEGMRLPAIHHEFIWSRGTQTLAGRLWPSSDGKRRTLYPMAICAHGFDLSAEAAIGRLLPLLEVVEKRCRGIRSAEEVRAIIAEGRDLCRSAVAGMTSGEPDRPVLALPEEFVKGPLPAILREARRNLAEYLRGKFRERRLPASVGLRVPSLAVDTVNDLVFWNRFFAAILDPDAPILLLKPVAQPWLDVIAGEPTTQDFFALRAQPPAVPILGELDGDIDAVWQGEAETLCAAIVGPGPAAAPAERPWLKKIFG